MQSAVRDLPVLAPAGVLQPTLLPTGGSVLAPFAPAALMVPLPLSTLPQAQAVPLSPPDLDDETAPSPTSATKNAVEAGSSSERRVWTADEDVQIAALVAEHGTRSWSAIAAKLPTRTGKQCRERWHNHLDPVINKSEWSLEEDQALLKAHETMGNKWADIAKTLPGRTDNQIKNRWNSALRRELRKLNRLANKQKGAVAAAINAATAAAAAVGGASESGTGGDDECDFGAGVGVGIPTAGYPAAAAASPEHSAGGAPKVMAGVISSASPAAAAVAAASGKVGSSKTCKKKASLQLTATALSAATDAQSTLLDSAQPLPHGVTEEDQSNAKVLLEHMHELNVAWVRTADGEGKEEADAAEATNTKKLAWHMDWLQCFCTTLVEKSLLRRNEKKDDDEEGGGKKRRRSAGAAGGAKKPKEPKEPKQPRKPKEPKAAKGAGKGRKRKAKDEEDAEDDDEEEPWGPGVGTGGASGDGGSEGEPEEGVGFNVDELLGLVSTTRTLQNLMGDPTASEKPLLTLSQHASHLASPLAIYNSDFEQSGCLSSPHHFLSPRTFEQLQADGAGLPSAALLSGLLPSAGHVLPGISATQPSAHSSRGSKPPTPRDEADGAAALLGMSTSQPSSAKSSGLGSAGSHLSQPNCGSVVFGADGKANAADVAAMVYDALGGAGGARLQEPALAAAAPAVSSAKRQRSAARASPLVPGAALETEQGYEGAGMAERRKPSGLGNLMIGAPASSLSGSSPLVPLTPAGSDSNSVVQILGSSHSSREGPSSATAAPADAAADASASDAADLTGITALVGMPQLASQPASARSVDLAALASPALHSLHSLGMLAGSSLPASARINLPSANLPSAVAPSPRLVPSPRLAGSLTNGSSPKGSGPHAFSGERSPLSENPRSAVAC